MLNEILDEYKESNEECKLKLIKEFTNMLWDSKYRFKTYKKYYTYKVNEDLFGGRNDLIDMFNKYQIIEFTFCKSFYDDKLTPIDYIRIHINNMYGFLIGKNIYLSKEYYKLLLTPKNEYFAAIDKIKNNEDINCGEIENRIIEALENAEKIRTSGNDKKLDLKWSEYKKLINTYIERLFNNYISPHEYEEINGWEMKVSIDGWSEDNYIVKYFCRSLTGYLRNYVRDSTPKEVKEKKCVICEIKIENINNKKKYCEKCAKEKWKEQVRANMINYRKRKSVIK